MIAERRMQQLLGLAEEKALQGNMMRGKRYVELARRIALRTNTKMPKGFMYCHKCLAPLIPGRNSMVRVKSHRVIIRCKECGYIRRIPYLRELKEKRRTRNVEAIKG
ncbi:MAG: ribonuclease P protein component 4 [Methanomassiliicoccales archaeon]